MPNANRFQPIWLGTFKTPDEVAIPYDDFYAQGGQPGSLGQVHEWNDKTYQRVQLDSGATASTPNGLPAANDLLYWKDKDAYLVTNDRIQALGSLTNDGYRNQVAGILRLSPTAAQVTARIHIDVLQRGDNISVASDGNGAAGGVAVAEAGANNRVAPVTAGTAPTCIPVGVIRGAAVANVIAVDVNIPSIP